MKRISLQQNNQSGITLEKFFKLLSDFYGLGVTSNKQVFCKYYLQESTFSFELHDRTKLCFSAESHLMDSDVYYFWNHKATREQIIKDILEAAAKYDIPAEVD